MNKSIQWYSGLNIYYQFIPFLLIYAMICIVFAPGEFINDEEKYFNFANNLLKGFYSPPPPEINLWNGPGYPAVIALFLFFKLPLMVVRLFNSFLLYASLLLNYKIMTVYCSRKSSLLFTVLLGLYYPVFEMLPLLHTECLTWFLISLTCFLFLKRDQQTGYSWKFIFLSALSITYLALTKVLFGYVILAMIFISFFMSLIPLFRKSAVKALMVFLLSFIFCLPYLFYTYSITDKLFYWSDAGGMSLYTMSTPYKNELGDWNTAEILSQNPNHSDFMEKIIKLPPLQRDEAYKKAAIENIKHYPKKYISNWIANIGRLLFSYPFSNSEQTIKSYFTLLPNMFVIVFITLASCLSLFHYKKIPAEIIILFFFIFIYLSGSTLVSAYRRMFYITMPFWMLFLSIFFNNIVLIKIKED